MSFLVKATFRKFDSDGDGVISRDEFKTVLSSLAMNSFSDKQLDALMEAADKNQDGVLLYDEVIDWIFAEGNNLAGRAAGVAKGAGKFISGLWDPEKWAAESQKVFPATVVMFSGCQDCQTSADVRNTASFNLPEDAGPGGAGGACTNSMIKAISEADEYTWASLLARMRAILDGRYTQIPMLSSSRGINLNTPFSVVNPESNGKFRALLIGINYPGSSAELSGCHNDIETMRRYLNSQGYEDDCMKILMDDGDHEEPTYQNISSGFQWLSEGAEAGDSLFLHYSGHGASIKDDNDDEEDGKDEALVPCDYCDAGLLRDDDTFKLLVAPLRDGAWLTCVLDCCHSGTILDLPYMFKADEQGLDGVSSGEVSEMQPNPFFDFNRLIAQVMKKVTDGGLLDRLKSDPKGSASAAASRAFAAGASALKKFW